MKFKGKWLVVVIVLAILVLAFAFFRVKNSTPITDVSWDSKSPGKLDIAWYDKEIGQVYTIYWSDQPGIKIFKPETYRGSIKAVGFSEELHHLAQIEASYEWVYFVISKSGCTTREFEAVVLPPSEFTCRNLDPQIIKRSINGSHMVVNVNVLDDADSYVLTQYHPDGTMDSEEFDVRGMKDVQLRIPFVPEAVGFLEMKKSGRIGAKQFFFYQEILSSGPYKWETVSQLC